MKPTPSLWLIIPAVALLFSVCFCPTAWMPIWHEELFFPSSCHRASNPGKNAVRRNRRWQRWQRRFPRQASKGGRKRRAEPTHALPQPVFGNAKCAKQSLLPDVVVPPPDPLAELRNCRDWINQVDYRQLSAVIQKVRWPQGPVCPVCGELRIALILSIMKGWGDGAVKSVPRQATQAKGALSPC